MVEGKRKANHGTDRDRIVNHYGTLFNATNSQNSDLRLVNDWSGKKSAKALKRNGNFIVKHVVIDSRREAYISKTEEDALELCKDLMSEKRQFIIFSCHTPLLSPLVLQNVMAQVFGKDHLKTDEMVLGAPGACSIPSGCYAIKTYG